MKIAVVSNVDFNPWQFRSEFIASLVHNGHQVTIFCTDGPYVERLKAIGAEHVSIPSNRFYSPIQDVRYIHRLYREIRGLKPDIVYTMTTKPNCFGPVVAKFAGVPRVYSLYGGVGFIFTEGGGLVTRAVKRVAMTIMRFGTRFVDAFVFQNKDDRELMIRRKIATVENSIVVSGSGINLREYAWETVDREKVARFRTELGIDDTTTLVVMVSRVSRNKGIYEYKEAARLLKESHPHLLFLHVGSCENGSLENVDTEVIADTENFRRLGFRIDVKEIIAASDIVTLPSYHREGIPNTLLEALALKKPIVTTDNVGCRETVDHDVNGLLIPVRDPRALADAIGQMADDPKMRERMGTAGLEKAIHSFSVESVNRIILENVFEFEDVRIPDFYVEENGDRLTVCFDDQKRIVSVPFIGNDHQLAAG